MNEKITIIKSSAVGKSEIIFIDPSLFRCCENVDGSKTYFYGNKPIAETSVLKMKHEAEKILCGQSIKMFKRRRTK